MKFYQKLFLCICLLFIHCILLTAQNETSFNQEDLKKFVAIYLDSKRITFNQDSLITNLLQKCNLDQELYIMLLKNSIENEDQKVLKENQTLLKEIAQINDELEKIKKNNIVIECAKYGMKEENYLSILERYKSDPLFQNSLVVYFEEYIKKQ